MDGLQTRTDNTPKQRNFRFWVSRFAFIVGLVLLAYYGYCFGLWGRKNLLVQYFFPCSCPSLSEEWRYPKRVDVIVSACHNGGVRLSPSGRLLAVRERKDEHSSTYILDLKTNERIPFSLSDSKFYFLNDNLLYVFVYYVADEYILDRTTNMMYPIKHFGLTYMDVYINGDVDLAKLTKALWNVKDVYLIEDQDLIVALTSDFRTSPESIFLSGWFDMPRKYSIDVEPFLRDYTIGYQTVPPNFPGEAISPNGRFIALYDGIYLVETHQKIVDGYKFSWYDRSYSGQYLSLRGWKYDSSGAIYSQFIGPCLLEPPGLDGPGCTLQVPQPVILLKVPEEYLSSP